MAYIWFKKLAKKVWSDALAAYIGRKKYGKKVFQHAAATWTSLRNKKPLLRRKK